MCRNRACARKSAASLPPASLPPAIYPYDGETISLEQFAQQVPATPPPRCRVGAPHWHLLWLLFPLIFVGKWLLAGSVLALGTLWQMLWQPLLQDVSLMPLLLIGVGVLLLIRNTGRD